MKHNFSHITLKGLKTEYGITVVTNEPPYRGETFVQIHSIIQDAFSHLLGPNEYFLIPSSFLLSVLSDAMLHSSEAKDLLSVIESKFLEKQKLVS